MRRHRNYPIRDCFRKSYASFLLGGSLTRIALAFTIFISSLAYAEVTDISCVQNAATEYTLSYRLTDGSRDVKIFASTDPAGRGPMQLIAKTSNLSMTIHAGKSGERIYFFLEPDHGQRREVSIRRLPLEGTPNFRDLGGYETTDGRFVRWGMLYRSGVLTSLTPSDLGYLSQLGVKVVCDFRTAQENAVAPEKWIDDRTVQHVAVPIDATPAKGNSDVVKSLLSDHPTVAQLRSRLDQSYQRMVIDSAPQYATVFRQLREDRLPLLYHCTAGKDRTGVFSALLLLSLGVPRETVFADYALTNNYLTPDAQRQMARASANPAMAQISPEQARVLMAADPEYLRSALAAIDEKYGSFDNYRRRALGVSDADLEGLKSRLLTK
jgi:protein-tyrosine phosphatase